MEDFSSLSPALISAEEAQSAAAASDPSAAEHASPPAFTGKELTFAWLLLAAGYLFWRVFPMSQ